MDKCMCLIVIINDKTKKNIHYRRRDIGENLVRPANVIKKTNQKQ